MDTSKNEIMKFIPMLDIVAVANFLSLLCVFSSYVVVLEPLSVSVLFFNILLLFLVPIMILGKLILDQKIKGETKPKLFVKLLLYLFFLESPTCILFLFKLAESGI